ncbi:hypothetical protein DRN93_05115, partial [archaeon]
MDRFNPYKYLNTLIALVRKDSILIDKIHHGYSIEVIVKDLRKLMETYPDKPIYIDSYSAPLEIFNELAKLDFCRLDKAKRVITCISVKNIVPNMTKKVKLVPANLLETGRSGYYVEYNGKPAYTASTKEDLMDWL